MAKNTLCGVQLRIRDGVQGVGFRPFVWQLAQQLNLHGDVCSDGGGVEIRLLEDPETFLVQLYQHYPPLARIDGIEREPFTWSQLPTKFTIRQSAGDTMNTQVVPDVVTCPVCLAEMNIPGERRYCYSLINRTHCGPRFIIIHATSYDRPFTVMAGSLLCPARDKKYHDSLDRRFHAQPVACPRCGPHLEWISHGEHAGQEVALQAAIIQLKMGSIVAIKGTGGFHLVCDAHNSDAVATFRARKHCPAKPLAVMLPVVDGLPDAMRQLLTMSTAPIMLVDKKYVPESHDDIVPGLNEVRAMLPVNPSQHLLLQELQCPLVMTSGNLSGKPPAISNEQVLADLQGIAGRFLIHNHDIV